MLTKSTATWWPVDGQANQPPPESWASQPELADPTLESRKGRLYLLVAQGTSETVPATAYRRYYSATSFDILPSLRSALSAIYLSTPEAEKGLPVAVVIHGLDMYAVGTAAGAIWLVRSGEVKELLSHPVEAWVSELPREGNQAGSTSDPGRGPAPDPVGGLALYNIQRRLTVGDTLVISTRGAAEKLNLRAVRQTVLSGGSPTALAQTVARLARRGTKSPPPPVTVIHVPGFSPAPELGPAQGRLPPAEGPAKVRAAHQASPIWPALVLALLAISISLWVKRASLSRENLSALLGWLLTPAPTTTSVPASVPPSGRTASAVAQSTSQPIYTTAPSPARTPRPRGTTMPSLTPSPTLEKVYVVPELVYPLEGAKIGDFALTMKWSWAGSLEEDEYFDVRLWPVGAPKRGIAWTKNREYTQRYQGAGAYYWTVAVIRGKDGVMQAELSQDAKPVGFEWRIEDQGPTRTYTPVPTVAPTRSTPIDRPTRVTPTSETIETPSPNPTPSVSIERPR